MKGYNPSNAVAGRSEGRSNAPENRPLRRSDQRTVGNGYLNRRRACESRGLRRESSRSSSASAASSRP